MKRYLILLASGTGSRFGASCPKQYVKICGKMVIEHTLAACDCDLFDECILVVSAPYVAEMREVILSGGYRFPIRVVEGGASRKESCEKGLAAISGDGLVIVHNGVQPFVTIKSFKNCFAALETYKAVTCGIPCVYTVLMANEAHVLTDTPDRSRLYCDFGPEGFHISFLRIVLAAGRDDNVSTGICGVVFRKHMGEVFVAEGDPGNIKITYQEDLAYAEKALKGRVGDGKN